MAEILDLKKIRRDRFVALIEALEVSKDPGEQYRSIEDRCEELKGYFAELMTVFEVTRDDLIQHLCDNYIPASTAIRWIDRGSCPYPRMISVIKRSTRFAQEKFIERNR